MSSPLTETTKNPKQYSVDGRVYYLIYVGDEWGLYQHMFNQELTLLETGTLDHVAQTLMRRERIPALPGMPIESFVIVRQ